MDIVRRKKLRPRSRAKVLHVNKGYSSQDFCDGGQKIYQERNEDQQSAIAASELQQHQESAHIIRLGMKESSQEVPMFYESSYVPPQEENIWQQESPREDTSTYQEYQELEESPIEQVEKEISQIPFMEKVNMFLKESRPSFSFAVSGLIVLLVLGTISFVSSGLHLKGKVLGVSKEAYTSLEEAIEGMKNQDFESSAVSFREANVYFSQAAEDFESWGGFFVEADFSLPVLSQLTTGKYALKAGRHLTSAGEKMNSAVEQISYLENPFDEEADISLLATYKEVIRNIEGVNQELNLAEEAIEHIKIADLPEDKRQEFILLKDVLPTLRSGIQGFIENSDAFVDVFGGNGPRKFLFLFQNNHELRATGGFIGSYGLLDINDGTIRKFFIDGIFNPDGQLSIDVVPPKPIQKISAGWSLHDSNWFADFPVSAEKAIYFYEKTGGPTVDGVITVTPTVMGRLLEVTGPIYLDQYDLTINTENFMESIQHQVEVDYDKEENRPKKVLADLAPVLLEKVFQFEDFDSMMQILDIFHSSIQEKHLLLYARNEDLQQMYSELGWSGEVQESPHDYLSVVHTNINGYKTDGVIDEVITHEAKVQNDGRIINTVTITREHQGGNTPYEWWNKVNTDFMRVYVPKGSKLLSAEGHTREYNEDPLDYEALGFHRDVDVVKQEQSMMRDPNTGTYIFEESGKTVFGNWVYVSPKEAVTVRYTYELPFSLDVQKIYDSADSHSLLVQKQSGTIGASLHLSVEVPEEWIVEWMYPERSAQQEEKFELESVLRKDIFSAFILKKK